MKHKKTYKHPQLVVVVIASHNPLLLGSKTSAGFSGNPDEEEME